MGVRTRIGLGILGEGGFGSVELPEKVTLYCPQCGTPAADKDQCLVSFATPPVNDPDTPRALDQVILVVDCRNCGCDGKPPATIVRKREE